MLLWLLGSTGRISALEPHRPPSSGIPAASAGRPAADPGPRRQVEVAPGPKGWFFDLSDPHMTHTYVTLKV